MRTFRPSSTVRPDQTYFESDPPFEDKRRFGYNRDRCPDCMQVVIALLVTPQGFPLAYEVMPGNTAEQTTLAAFLEKIERQYGRSDRIWIMDRGIPTEETLALMREGGAPVRYLVGTPKGRLTRLEKAFLDCPWQEVRQSVDVKLLVEDGELYVLVRWEGRMLKERGMRRRRLKKLWRRLGELRRQSNSRDQLMLKLGTAKKEAGRAWSLIDIRVPETDEELAANGFSFHLRRDRLRRVRRREGRYLLRSNTVGEDPAMLWRLYMQPIEIERAFRSVKTVDLKVRPIHHYRPERVRAHVPLCMLAYHVEWHMRRKLAPILFDEDDPAGADAASASIVVPAKPSPSARRKAASNRTPDGVPVHSFRTILVDLATIARNRVQPKLPGAPPSTWSPSRRSCSAKRSTCSA